MSNAPVRISIAEASSAQGQDAALDEFPLFAALGDLVLVYDLHGRLIQGTNDLGQLDALLMGRGREMSFGECAFALAAYATPLDPVEQDRSALEDLLTAETFTCEISEPTGEEHSSPPETWLCRKRVVGSNTVLHLSHTTSLTRLRAQERASREAAEAAARAKSAFLASMSHELRTPLNGIIGFAEFMSLGVNPERTQDYANDVLTSARHLLSVVNDVLDLAKLDAGKTEAGKARVDLTAALDNALQMTRMQLESSGQTLVHTPPAGPIIWVGNQQHFLQIALNLISNASRYGPKNGMVSVEIAADGPYAILRVVDEGPGMTQEQIASARQPFVQVAANSAYSRTTGGTGLGLPITDALVRVYGGRLELTSNTPHGTIAEVRLPLSDD